jgi:release factor glutamine methyltransferase
MRKGLERVYLREEAHALVRAVMEEVCEVPPYKLLAGDDRPLGTREERRLSKITKRLADCEPLAYVLGRAYFCGLRLKVNRKVLIPRPETEELVEKIAAGCEGKELEILDVGTGSGCIACALAAKLPQVHVTAIDISVSALSTAQGNAQSSGVRVSFAKADMLREQSMDAALGAALFDVIVSNPPYVRESEKAVMAPNVLNYEPPRALFVPDEKPLLFYEGLVGLARKRLKPGGVFYVEINEALGRETETLVRESGLKEVEIQRDMRGCDRFIRAIR